jgi:hypothetical protein
LAAFAAPPDDGEDDVSLDGDGDEDVSLLPEPEPFDDEPLDEPLDDDSDAVALLRLSVR